MPDNSASDIATAIANAATKPASATIDGNSVSQISVGDKIKAADYTAANAITDVRQLFNHRTRLVNGPRQ